MPEAGDEAAGRRCTATTRAGQRCRNWALEESEPPRCRVHTHPEAHASLRHGYYRHPAALPEEMRMAIGRLAANGQPLAAEIAVARLKIAALLAYLNQTGLPPADWLVATRLLLAALRTTSRLMRTQHAFTQAKEDPHAG